MFKELFKQAPGFMVFWLISAALGLTLTGVFIWGLIRLINKFL